MPIVLMIDSNDCQRLCQAVGLLGSAEVTQRIDRAVTFLEETRLERPLILQHRLTSSGDDLIRRMRWVLPDVQVYVITENPHLASYLDMPGTMVFTEPLDSRDEGRLATLLRGECRRGSDPVAGGSKLQFGRYVAQEEIAVGGEGTIYRGWDPLLRRPVAIKQGLKTNLDSQRRSKWEGCKAASIDHPHVVQIFDCVTLADGYALVMEYLPGGDLATRLREEGRLSGAESCRLGLAVAKALRATHEAGLAHGDVKPGNVLIGDSGRFKLADFGAAGSGYHCLQSGFRGTPGYLPPETYFDQEYTPASDTYAAGVLIHRALTGQVPFTGTSLVDLMNASLSKAPPSCRWAAPNDDIADLVAAMMAKYPAERPSLNTVISVFERFIEPARGDRFAVTGSSSAELLANPRGASADPPTRPAAATG
ncbi:MAG: serine/threonine-protein kinase [Acidobacteriota bacterium]